MKRASLGALILLAGAGCSGSDSTPARPLVDAGAEVSANDAADADAALDAGVTNDAACMAGPERNGPYQLLTIVGNPGVKGAFDPSVEYAADAPFGLMTYTMVPDEASLEIAIATSVDHGAIWTHTASVTSADPITITTSVPDACSKTTSCSGTLIAESSSLVLDPFDDASRRLKVFAHRYFYGAERHLELGYLAMYTAATPVGPWTESKLFGWKSPTTLSTDGVLYDVSSDPRLPELHDCYILGEPGARVRAPGTIDLALSCVMIQSGAGVIDVRLLRSEDHGQTWTFVSTLLTAEDGDALGSDQHQVNGSDLFSVNGHDYVVVSPGGTVSFPGGSGPGNRGCVVIPIADIVAGQVERCAGKPVVAAAYLGQPGQFVGVCSADEGASVNGMMIPVPDFGQPDLYRIMSAGSPLP